MGDTCECNFCSLPAEEDKILLLLEKKSAVLSRLLVKAVVMVKGGTHAPYPWREQ